MQMLSEKQILEKKQIGDANVVAQVLSKENGKYITPAYVAQIFSRETSQYHVRAMEVLRGIVEYRERLINEAINQ